MCKFAKCTKCGRAEGVLSTCASSTDSLNCGANEPERCQSSQELNVLSNMIHDTASAESKVSQQFLERMHRQKLEGKMSYGGGVDATGYFGGETGCQMGGKCMFKFAKCIKCGCAEGVLLTSRRISSLAGRPERRCLPAELQPFPDHCQNLEMTMVPGGGAIAYPGGEASCPMGGKCMCKFAKCTKCGRAEGVILSSRRTSISTEASMMDLCHLSPDFKVINKISDANSSESETDVSKLEGKIIHPSCPAGGKCLFKFAKCIKCGCAEGLTSRRISLPTEASSRSRRSSVDLHALSQTPEHATSTELEACKQSPDGMHHWKFGKCSHCQKLEGKLIHGRGTLAYPGGEASCPIGGKCVCKFGQCAKCGREEGVIHLAQLMSTSTDSSILNRRSSCPELGTLMQISDNIGSESEACQQSPNGMHHWKFGKCSYCQEPQGKMIHGNGVMAYPGGDAKCLMGGKCMFKFATCTKCGCAEGVILTARRHSV